MSDTGPVTRAREARLQEQAHRRHNQLAINQSLEDAAGDGIYLFDAMPPDQRTVLLSDRHDAGPTTTERATEFVNSIERNYRGDNLRDLLASDPAGAADWINSHGEDPDQRIGRDADRVAMLVEETAGRLMASAAASGQPLPYIEAFRRALRQLTPEEAAAWRGDQVGMPQSEIARQTGSRARDEPASRLLASERDPWAVGIGPQGRASQPGAHRRLAGESDPHGVGVTGQSRSGMPARALPGAHRRLAV